MLRCNEQHGIWSQEIFNKLASRRLKGKMLKRELSEKYPNTKFLRSIFSRTWIEYWDLQHIPELTLRISITNTLTLILVFPS